MKRKAGLQLNNIKSLGTLRKALSRKELAKFVAEVSEIRVKCFYV